MKVCTNIGHCVNICTGTTHMTQHPQRTCITSDPRLSPRVMVAAHHMVEGRGCSLPCLGNDGLNTSVLVNSFLKARIPTPTAPWDPDLELQHSAASSLKQARLATNREQISLRNECGVLFSGKFQRAQVAAKHLKDLLGRCLFSVFADQGQNVTNTDMTSTVCQFLCLCRVVHCEQSRCCRGHWQMCGQASNDVDSSRLHKGFHVVT
ncbi:hypothetical protein BaRGS_00016327 [Batillaria attramentaria]|uniref:Uncharacterized protein n=1 Tax=Batillaria attramentaria TaxID=370345 RepID=A0ABD0KZ70_9CAEN